MPVGCQSRRVRHPRWPDGSCWCSSSSPARPVQPNLKQLFCGRARGIRTPNLGRVQAYVLRQVGVHAVGHCRQLLRYEHEHADRVHLLVLCSRSAHVRHLHLCGHRRRHVSVHRCRVSHCQVVVVARDIKAPSSRWRCVWLLTQLLRRLPSPFDACRRPVRVRYWQLPLPRLQCHAATDASFW